MKLGPKVGVLSVVATVVLVAIFATSALSAAAVHAPKPPAVHVRVVPADRYCTPGIFGSGRLMRCRGGHRGRFRVGGAHNEWLVIFSFVAPMPTTLDGRVYYFFTVRGPSGCSNGIQFGAAFPGAVRKGQRVVGWATFDRDCPGPGHGTIGLRRTRAPLPLDRVGRLLARFTFTIP